MLRLGDARRVLAVEAHPDDLEMGAGATLARLARLGARMRFLSLTGGERGTREPVRDPVAVRAEREREARAAAAHLGAEEVRVLDFEDMRLADTPETRAAVVEEIRAYRPDTVFCLDPSLADEAHPDHRAAGRIAMAAALFAAFPHVPMADGVAWEVSRVVLYATDRPNLIFDVSDTWEQRWQALALHASQFSRLDLGMLKVAVTAAARVFAAQAGQAVAEPLRMLAPYELHMYALPVAAAAPGWQTE